MVTVTVKLNLKQDKVPILLFIASNLETKCYIIEIITFNFKW